MAKSNSVKSVALVVSWVVACGAVSSWANDGKVTLLSTTQSAKILELPDMSMNHVDYRALKVEYGVGGDASITQLKKVVSKLTCNGAIKSVEQLEVGYEGPKTLLRITDLTHNEVKFLGFLPSEGRNVLGRASCDSTDTFMALNEQFTSKKSEFLKNITQKGLSEAPAKVDDFVRNNAVVKARPLQLTSFQFKSSGTEFAAINQAFDIATKAYDMIDQKDALIEPAEGIKGAITLWEAAMRNPTLLARADAKVLRAAIAYNLSSAYLISMNYMQSAYSHKLAVTLNNESGNTLRLPDNQSIIDRQLHNRALSNTVPNDMVALITLERMGSEYLKNIEVNALSDAAYGELIQQQGGQGSVVSKN